LFHENGANWSNTCEITAASYCGKVPRIQFGSTRKMDIKRPFLVITKSNAISRGKFAAHLRFEIPKGA
jgi:hypothetical protein